MHGKDYLMSAENWDFLCQVQTSLPSLNNLSEGKPRILCSEHFLPSVVQSIWAKIKITSQSSNEILKISLAKNNLEYLSPKLNSQTEQIYL